MNLTSSLSAAGKGQLNLYTVWDRARIRVLKISKVGNFPKGKKTIVFLLFLLRNSCLSKGTQLVSDNSNAYCYRKL